MLKSKKEFIEMKRSNIKSIKLLLLLSFSVFINASAQAQKKSADNDPASKPEIFGEGIISTVIMKHILHFHPVAIRYIF